MATQHKCFQFSVMITKLDTVKLNAEGKLVISSSKFEDESRKTNAYTQISLFYFFFVLIRYCITLCWHERCNIIMFF